MLQCHDQIIREEGVDMAEHHLHSNAHVNSHGPPEKMTQSLRKLSVLSRGKTHGLCDSQHQISKCHCRYRIKYIQQEEVHNDLHPCFSSTFSAIHQVYFY